MGHRLHVDGAGWTWRQVQVRALSHKKANHREEGIPGQSLQQEGVQEPLPVLSIHNHQQMTEVSLLIHIYKHQPRREVQDQTISQRKENRGEEGDPGQSQSLHQGGAQDSLPELSIHNHQEMTEVHSAGITNR